jgi:hypothetical protein
MEIGYVYEDATDINCGRGAGGKNMLDTEVGEKGWLGNPFVIREQAEQKHKERSSIEIVDSRAESIEKFEQALREKCVRNPRFRAAVADLAGQNLGCWCQGIDEDGPACHTEAIRRVVQELNE